jgi:hypothetical protein
MSGQGIARALRRAYLELDPRSLGLGRIGLGLLLLFDLIRRVPWARDLYSNDGLLPNHTLLWRPPAERMFSLLWPVSWPGEVVLAFTVCFAVYFCLLIGYRTRLAHVLAFLACISLHNRIQFAENGGSVAMTALVLWTMFMPLGRRFSVDAALARLRGRTGDAAPPAPPDEQPFVSLVVLAFLLQLSVIYLFNYAHKTGPTWREGTAVWYVLWQERITTHLAVWARHHLPFAFTKALTHGTLVVEAAAPFLLLTPVLWRYTRPLAIVSLAGLHIGIAMMSNLGAFSYAMLSYYPFLLAREHWDWLARRRGLIGRVREFLQGQGQRIEGLLARALAAWGTSAPRAPSPLQQRWQQRRWLVREALVLFVGVVVAMEVLVANSAVPRWMKPRRPDWMVAAMMYTHLYEGWSMFSPDAPLGDLMTYLDAVTVDGRHVDPLNEAGSRWAGLPVRQIPVRLNHDSFFCDYTLRIPDAGSYHQALIEWVMRYHLRTGRPQDQIVSFEGRVIEHRSPAPGSVTPHSIRERVFLRHQRP